jgi:hypothetical protein
VFKQTAPSKLPEMVNSTQHEITKTMYTILIDWLIEIGTISDHTLCLAVHILDEYLHNSVIARSHFQLVGCTCLLIASKLEEIQFPSIDDLVTVACNCFTAEEVIAMEQKILRKLNYEIPRPTRSYFLERFLLVSRADCFDLQRKKKFQQQSLASRDSAHHYRSAAASTLFPNTSSSASPTSVRNNPSPALSTLTDDESSPLSFSAISAPSFDATDSNQWATTPVKAGSAAAREAIKSLDDVDLTSNESQSQLFSSPSSTLPHSASSSFTHSPKHGYIPTSSQFLREESFARLLLHLTLQVSFHSLPSLAHNSHHPSIFFSAGLQLQQISHVPSCCSSGSFGKAGIPPSAFFDLTLHSLASIFPPPAAAPSPSH